MVMFIIPVNPYPVSLLYAISLHIVYHKRNIM